MISYQLTSHIYVLSYPLFLESMFPYPRVSNPNNPLCRQPKNYQGASLRNSFWQRLRRRRSRNGSWANEVSWRCRWGKYLESAGRVFIFLGWVNPKKFPWGFLFFFQRGVGLGWHFFKVVVFFFKWRVSLDWSCTSTGRDTCGVFCGPSVVLF